MSSSSLETCPGCGKRGLRERIKQHDCPCKQDSGVTAHAEDSGLRLVDDSIGEWIVMDYSMAVEP